MYVCTNFKLSLYRYTHCEGFKNIADLNLLQYIKESEH
ncbi:Uncharacterised protein [Sphingobacterium spiritivorum]|uniref:Uncharacterized protein n=1 Tax=Sphingobacterium spiritivorum TaxID=258 RepID=A0A380BKK2_SPHSI|nr:Uncharacterised protein [Sphingobacterium spiritivorum]